MNNIKKKYFLIILFILWAILFLCIFQDSTCSAEETLPVTKVSIENGKLTTTAAGNISYSLFSGIYYSYSSVNDNDVGINKILKDTNTSIFKLFDENNVEIPIAIKNGYYISYAKNGIPKYFKVYNEYCQIQYELDGGINSPSNPEAFYPNNNQNIALSTPQKNGYKFVGWFLESTFENCIASINCNNYSKDLKLYAYWSKLNNINISFSETNLYDKQTSIIGNVDYYYHGVLNRYIFNSSPFKLLNNYTDSTYYIYNKDGNPIRVYSNTYYYCLEAPCEIVFKKPFYEVVYNTYDGIFDAPPYNYYFSSNDLLSIPNISKEGYEFCGWYLDENYTQTFTDSEFTPQDIVLYAKWNKLNYIDVLFQFSDYYTTFNNNVDTVSFYLAPNGLYYIYSNNLLNKYNEYKIDADVSIEILTSENKTIAFTSRQGKYCSAITEGTPSSIIIKEPYYSITYNLVDDDLIENPINYYKNKLELNTMLSPSIKDGYRFIGWYTNEELTSTFSNSSFIEQDITLYPKYSKTHPIDVYHYTTATATTPSFYEKVGTIEYYEYLDYFYCFGDLTNTTSQNNIGYYLNKYENTSFHIVDNNNNRLACTTKNGKCLSKINSGLPDKVYIYNHYTYKLYINGEYFFETNGSSGEKVILPTDIKGYIGKNYDAIDINGFTIGNRYAVYIFKGWSFTDTSDKSWFDKAEVKLIDNLTYDNDEVYIKNIYAYMTFYSKISEKNSNINYDQYISETHGIITSTSKYSIDDLLLEHATEISSDTQLSTGEKIAKALHLDDSNPLIKFLDSFISKDNESFSDIWNNLVGKIFIIFSAVIILVFYLLLLKTFIFSFKSKHN